MKKRVGDKIKHKAVTTLNAGESVTLDDGRYVVSFGASAGNEATLSFIEPVAAPVKKTETKTKTEDEQ
jgi:hypothetical protein